MRTSPLSHRPHSLASLSLVAFAFSAVSFAACSTSNVGTVVVPTSEGGPLPTPAEEAGAPAVVAPPSCRERAASGAGASDCGLAEDTDCCASSAVPGGKFYRWKDRRLSSPQTEYPATVSPFTLDVFEITVGRFRRFADEGNGTRKKAPKEGSGAHPKIPGSGWKSAYNALLPADRIALDAELTSRKPVTVWTLGAGPHERRPMKGLSWALAFAFCAWDGGRLPTQPELGSVNGAWGPGAMPWGGSATSFRDTVAGNEAGRIVYPFNQDGTCPGNSCFLVPMLTAAGVYNPAAATVNTTNFNPFPSSPGVFNSRYVYPVPADTATNDQAYAVAAPGRMRNDFRSVGPGATDGYFDIAANLIEVTGTVTNTDTGNAGDPNNPVGFHLDSNGSPLPNVSWVGGSFEGHTPNNRGGYNLDVLTKYGKAGGRCAYDN